MVALHTKYVEPVKRNKDGMRWVVHRFPIKGGITLRDVWLQEMRRPNSMVEKWIESTSQRSPT